MRLSTPSAPTVRICRAFESLVSDAYRTCKISHAQVGKMLGLDRWKADAFLK
jgi:hypothetical protein